MTEITSAKRHVLLRITTVIVGAFLSLALVAAPANASVGTSSQTVTTISVELASPLSTNAGETGPYVDQFYDNIGPCELRGSTYVDAGLWTRYFCAVNVAYPHSYYTLYYWLAA